jgi:hypothetical protein
MFPKHGASYYLQLSAPSPNFLINFAHSLCGHAHNVAHFEAFAVDYCELATEPLQLVESPHVANKQTSAQAKSAIAIYI